MANGLFAALRQEYRDRASARFILWVVAYGAALWLMGRFGHPAPLALWVIFWAAFIAGGATYLWRITSLLKHRILWRVRWRLVVTYLFIAVVPIVLILFLAGTASVIAGGQLAAYLAAVRLKNRYDQLANMNRVVAREAQFGAATSPQRMLNLLESFCTTEFASEAKSDPQTQVTLELAGETRAFRLDGSPIAKPPRFPAWLAEKHFAGIAEDRNRLWLRAAALESIPAGQLKLMFSEPITPQLLDRVGRRIGPTVVRWGPPPRDSDAPPVHSEKSAHAVALHSSALQIPPSEFFLDPRVGGVATLPATIWNGGQRQTSPWLVVLLTTSRLFAMGREIFASSGAFSGAYVVVFKLAGILFLSLEVFALVIGIRLTRSITTTVDRLQVATERVKAGEFSYRIQLPARDQLSALGEAFDGMTASVERLMVASEEKTRLESEVEIAREVQRQLFPRRTPALPGLELHAVCHAARGVSGDYYDFLPINDNQVGIVLGDVSGKGISAALLMASLQSALRAQHLAAVRADSGASLSTARILRGVNRQMHDSTPTEKYATMFYAVYDAQSRRLIYTNAGHPAPLLIRAGGIERLAVGGTPIGLIPAVNYEEASVSLQSGDLLIVFSDGVTEPENNYDEEFSEARLMQAVRHATGAPLPALIEEITRSVNDWTGSSDLQDDMTLIVGRATV